MGIFSTLPFGILKTSHIHKDLSGFLRKLGSEVCPECERDWNSTDRSPIQEKCGHLKCRQCFVRSFVAVKTSCPQCISACPECEVEWNDSGVTPVQEKCGHIKCRKCFAKNLLSCLSGCPQCEEDDPEEAAGPPVSPKKEPVVIISAPPSTKLDSAVGRRRASCLESSTPVSRDSYNESRLRRRSTGTYSRGVNIFEKKWEKKFKETSGSTHKRKIWLKNPLASKQGKVVKVNKTSPAHRKNSSPVDKSPSAGPIEIPAHINVLKSGGEVLYECTKCKKKFRTRHHVRYHSFCQPGAKKPFQCDICLREFAIQSHYKYHMMTHESEKPFKCTVCGKGHSKQLELSQHMRYHSMDRSFVCTLCGRAFHTQNILSNHMFTHGGRQYQCKYCDKKFARLVFLTKHELVHTTGEKPYKCLECSSSFSRKDGLERHCLHVHKLNIRTMPTYTHLYQKIVKPRVPPTPPEPKKKSVGKAAVMMKQVKEEPVTDSMDSSQQSNYKEQIQPATATVTASGNNGTLTEGSGWESTPMSVYSDGSSNCFDTINRDDFADLKLEASFPSRPFICPMCGTSFAHKEDVDWHVRIMHAHAESGSISDVSPSKAAESSIRDSVRENMMALLNENSPETRTQYQMPTSSRSSALMTSEFYQSTPHHVLNEFGGGGGGGGSNNHHHQLKSEFGEPLLTHNTSNNGPEFIEPAHVFVTDPGFSLGTPIISSSHSFNGAHYIEPACIINGPGYGPPQPLQPALTAGPEKFDDLITLSSSFMFNNYESNNSTNNIPHQPPPPPPPPHISNGVPMSQHQPMIHSMPEYIVTSTAPDQRIYTDLRSAYPDP